MASGALIDTSNRLLGWATSDFALYGGQAAVTIGAPVAPSRISDGLTVPDPASASRSAAPQSAPAREETAQAADQPHGDLPSAFHFTPFAPAPIQFGDPIHANAFEAAVPAATGSGAPAATVEMLHAPVFAPVSFAPPTLAAEPHAAEAPPLASVPGLTAPVLGLSDALDHTISSLSTTTDNLLGETQQAIDALPSVSDILNDTHLITAADGFLGDDPAAGVATLVSMVDSADAFDLAHAGLDIPEVTASGSVLDTLAEDAAPLLGDLAHDADTIIPDPHHDGVLGLL
jgi:hypothetical protein